MRRLGVYVAGNAVLYGGYRWINPFPDYIVNRAVTAEICAVSIMCVVIPLVWTRHWRVLSVGLLGLFAGLALLYYPFATDGTILAIRDKPPASANTTPLWWTQLARTLLATGGAYVAYWLTHWAYEHRGEAFPMLRGGETTDPFDPAAQL